jgi:hypothetical protein
MTARALRLADGEHLVNFSGPFNGYCWVEPERKKKLYIVNRTIYRLLLETALVLDCPCPCGVVDKKDELAGSVYLLSVRR